MRNVVRIAFNDLARQDNWLDVVRRNTLFIQPAKLTSQARAMPWLGNVRERIFLTAEKVIES